MSTVVHPGESSREGYYHPGTPTWYTHLVYPPGTTSLRIVTPVDQGEATLRGVTRGVDQGETTLRGVITGC